MCARVGVREREGWSFAEEANAPTTFKSSPLSAHAAFSLSLSLSRTHAHALTHTLSRSLLAKFYEKVARGARGKSGVKGT